MKEFILWFINQIPGFLMSEPLSYFVGFFFAFAAVQLLGRLMSVGR